MSTAVVREPISRRWRGWLGANWPVALWIVVAITINVVAAMMAPSVFARLSELDRIPEADRETVRVGLAHVGLSPEFVAWFALIYNTLGALVRLSIGWLLIRRAPRTRFVTFFAFLLAAQTNVTYPGWIPEALPDQLVAQTIARLTVVVAVGGLFVVPFVFPDGRFVPRWTVVPAIYLLVRVVEFVFDQSLAPFDESPAVVGASFGLLLLCWIGSMVYRYTHVATAVQRQQTRWVVLGLIIGLPATISPTDRLSLEIDATLTGVVVLLLLFVALPLAEAAPTIAIAISVLQYRLFDIDVVLSRTLLWLAMTATIVGVYIGVVLGIGGLLGSEESLLLSLLATALVAMGFQPARQRVQRAIDRMLFGERDDPFAVLTRLGRQLEGSRDSDDLLSALVHTTAEMLRLPYVGLLLDHADGHRLVASSGETSASTVRMPLIYQGQLVGALDVAPRAPGQEFGTSDRRLLEALARQIATAAQTVKLADDLQASRERIVSSREEERRRLRRDLHDGLGAQLAALIMQAGAARSMVRSDPIGAERELTELREELRGAVVDVRRLVHGLRPPALDELGLVGALRLRLDRLDRGGIDAESSTMQVRLAIPDPLPPLSAAVEVAAFRIVEEAVTNVVKHARSTEVTVTLRADAGALLVSVVDDGVGISPPPDGGGVGMQSMRERATELGGSFAIGPGPNGRGAAVQVVLPNSSPSGR